MAWIAAAAQTVGSFLQSNANKNAQRANLAQETNLDNQMLDIYHGLMGKFNSLWGSINPAQTLGEAKNFYSSEVTGGLDPAVIGSANSNFQQENARNLATFKSQLGPYTPNLSGAIKDFANNETLGNVSLQQQLAAMNQGVRQQGAAGLTGIGEGVAELGAGVSESVAGGIGDLAKQFGTASMFNATNQTNPFSSIGSFLAANPGAFSGGGKQTGTPQAATPGTGGFMGNNDLWGYGAPQPGQGGLGATGGGGTAGAGGTGLGS